MNGRGGPMALVNIQATDFGLKNRMIQQVQNSCQFHRIPGDDANKHLDKFLTITQSMKQNGVSGDALRLYLFPYSLTHNDTTWFDHLPKNSIHTFEEMASKFLSKYFPPSMECYKLSIDQCPNHNMLSVTQIDTFYNGLTLRHRDTINVAIRGNFIKRRPEECYDLIKNMTAHHNYWDALTQRGESSRSTTYSSPEIAALTQQMAELTKNVLKISQINQQLNVVNLSCETCGGPHQYFKCQAIGGFTQGDVYATTRSNNTGGNSNQTQGNPNLLSYRSNNYLGPLGFNQPNNQATNLNKQNFQNRNNQSQNQYQNRSNQDYQNQGYQNQGFNNNNRGQSYNQNHAQTNFNQNQNFPSTDMILRQHMIESDAKFQLLANQMTKMEKAFNERPQGALPSNNVPNPREQINSIRTRSGLTTVEPSIPHHVPPTSIEEVKKEPKTLMDEVHITSLTSTAHISPLGIQPVSPPKPKEDPKPNPHQPKIPYPLRLAKRKLVDKNDVQVFKILKILKQLHFDISLMDALIQFPKYSKVLKYLLKDKDKLEELANTPINAECSAILLNKVPEKLEDPKKFLIPWFLYDLEVCNSLSDSGASINLMPLLIYEKLGIRPLKPTQMTLELANRSVIYPMDFEADPRVPIILGRPFLRTAKDLEDLYEEKLTLRIDNKELVFRAEKVLRYPSKDHHSVHSIDIVDSSSDNDSI
ncbi:hypothetical protein Tco_1019599 [Tanacetum coccineum]|uniref:Retrotransposon gag domain-containing protein n=1 Tax=Tanacetum coccineum TaxID=301880 RepID=A0ABQ5FZB3_9ASTR